jgi:hypothetical protein
MVVELNLMMMLAMKNKIKNGHNRKVQAKIKIVKLCFQLSKQHVFVLVAFECHALLIATFPWI